MKATLEIVFVRRPGRKIEPTLDDLIAHLKMWGGADVSIRVVDDGS